MEEKHTCSRRRCSPDMHKKRTEWCAVFWKGCDRMGHAPWNIYFRMAAHPGVQTLCCSLSHAGTILCLLQYYSVQLMVVVTTLRTDSLALLRETQEEALTSLTVFFFLLLKYQCYLL